MHAPGSFADWVNARLRSLLSFLILEDMAEVERIVCFVLLLDTSPFQSIPAPLTTTTTTTTTTMMRTTPAAFIFATCVLAQDGAPIVYDSIHNISSIEGTWSSGSQHVLTGAVCGPEGLCDHSLSNFSPSGFCKSGGVHLYLPIHSRHLVLFVGTIHENSTSDTHLGLQLRRRLLRRGFISFQRQRYRAPPAKQPSTADVKIIINRYRSSLHPRHHPVAAWHL